VNLQIQQSARQLRILAAVAPFAAVSGSADTLFIVTKAVASFIKVGWRNSMEALCNYSKPLVHAFNTLNSDRKLKLLCLD